MTIWVAGEALVDVLPSKIAVGGSPTNTARALALLGRQVEFIGGISSDPNGKLIHNKLKEDGVGLTFAHMSDLPSAEARVNLGEDGSAEYVFTTQGTASFDFTEEWLPVPNGNKPNLLYLGSLATIVEPGASALFDWAHKVSEFAPIVFDPNVRPAYLSDRDIYREAVEKWIPITTLIKASDEDISWLYPEIDIFEVVRSWLKTGVEVVLLTRGGNGIVGFNGSEVITVDAFPVDIQDTVGAGDTVGAVAADALLHYGAIEMKGETFRETLTRAALAAAITCSREGALPPTRLELDQRYRALPENRA